VHVLSDSERRAWADIERFWADEAEEPQRPGVQHRERQRSELATLWSVIGVRIAVVLALVGAPVAGLALATGVAAGWAVARIRRPSSRAWDVYSLPESGSAAPGPVPARRAVEWGPPFLRRLDQV
jgi:hypothetical protein